MRVRILIRLVQIALVLGIVTTVIWGQQAASSGQRGPVPVEVTTGIRAAYDIGADEWRDGVGRGLFYLGKLLDTYDLMEVDSSAVQVSGVFHGKAGYWLLTDAAYQEETGKEQANPNKAIVASLMKRGVSIELCSQTMLAHGWEPQDILPDVLIVTGAYPRLIDLQLRGHAYIAGF